MNKSKEVIVKEVYAFLKENHPMFNKEIRKKFSEKNKDVDKKISIHKIEQFILDNNWNDMNDNQFEYNLRCFLALLKDAHTMIGFIKTTPVECYLWRNGKNAYNNQFLYKNDEVFIKVNGQYEKVLQICGEEIDNIIEKIVPMLSYEIDERRNHLIGCFLNEVRTFEILKDTFDMFKVENLDKINVKIRTDNGDKNITVQSKKMGNENPFSIDIQNETLVFKARACSNRDCFSAIMSEIENNYKSNKFNKIVYDIRDNRGGSNAVMKPFHEFLKEHNLPYVAIVNNGTFSAGVWEAFACKKDYAKVIGDKIGQPMCRYGNCFKHYDNEMFSVYCSTQLYEINSSTSKNFVDSNRLVLDIEVSNSIKDLNDGKDLQLETAIKEVEKEYNSIKF